MSYGWGPGYGDPSHPTTGELPQVGDGRRGTGEMGTVQIDAVTDPNLPRVGGGDEARGSVGGLTVQIDRVRDPAAQRPAGDTQLLPRIAPRPKTKPVPTASERAAPTASPHMPVLRRQLGPDWTQMPLRLLAAAAVTLAVLGVSAASLLYIAEWINP